VFPVILLATVAVILALAWFIDHRTRRSGHKAAKGSDVAAEIRSLHRDGRARRAEMDLEITPRDQDRRAERDR
jgi:hypothetical protein